MSNGKYEAHVVVNGTKVRLTPRGPSFFTRASEAREAIRQYGSKVIGPNDTARAFTVNRTTSKRVPVPIARKRQ